ncbi:hypothetical protein TSUD_150670 [Trifolium subterraneum]|uniref:Replication factor A C-terminal domain-containing protein n=1 Tax=Trifolium subterraneum TaxID=3900 RepID=A0A2Z6M2L2_TRISU|nr:hypothetical protein TSUD_150670 [Trifolium subterraneum]
MHASRNLLCWTRQGLYLKFCSWLYQGIMRYRLELRVSDASDSTIFVLFDELAEQVAQVKLVDLLSALDKETDNDLAIPHQLQKIIGTTHVFQIKIKSYFEGHGRQSFIVDRIVRPKVKVEDDDKLGTSDPPRIVTPQLRQKRRRLHYEEESDDVEKEKIGSDLEE